MDPNLPSWLRAAALLVAAGSGLAGSAGAQVPVNNFSVPPGATVTITFDVDVKNPLAVCATSVSNQGSFAGTNVTPAVQTDDPDAAGAANPTLTGLDAVDLSITKTDGVATKVPGTAVTYTIVVSNAGPSAALGAQVIDTFPAILTGVSWTCAGAGGATCTAAGSGNISDFVNVPVGGTATYTVNATVAADATGTLVNTATVTAGGQIECNTANNSATDTDTLTPQADLGITKTDGVTSVDAGSSTTYTIVVTNSGPSDAVGATVADTFPAAVASVSWSCTASAGSTCTAGPVAGNINDVVTVRSGGTLTYTATANISGSASGNLVNTATVTAPGGTTDPVPGNNSATDTDTINPVADLSITKTDGVTTAVPGMSVTYTIMASNSGPATATGASVQDTFPATLTCSWTCVGAGGGTCTAGPVAGNIADSVNLPAGGSATYTAVCTIANNATGTLVNTATIGGGGVSDTNPGNNSATDTDTLLTLDFGDAPNGALPSPSGYPTLLADNGARHGVTALRMGAAIDNEADGQPTANADGDDANPALGPDDEDGVTLPAFFVTCETSNVTVNASAVARLDAWVDWNANGSFGDAGEKIFNNQALVAGANVLAVTAPCTASAVPKTFARFRLSTAGIANANGVAADGEVEDYTVAIRGLDFGDAPDPTFPTLFASNGARHVVGPGGPILGSLRDIESNGQPNGAATGDDLAGTDDEDGVVLTSTLIPGQTASVTVTASAPGVLRAWVDWDGDGSWATVGDELVFSPSANLAAGPNALTFPVPATANSNLTTFARFRVATVAVAGFAGIEPDGEVEDHQVQTVPVADVSITKTDGVTNEVPGTSVTYTITVSNSGPDGVTGANVTDTFPAAITGVTWTCAGAGGGTCTAAGAGNLNELVNLPSGGSVTFTATGTISPTASGTLVNTATVAVPSPVFDPVPGNNSATDTDTLTAEANISVTKTDGSATEIPGTPVTYMIVVSNAGPSTATSVAVTDTFPASLSGCSWTSTAAGGATGNTPGPVAGNIGELGLTMPPSSSVTYTATCNIDPAARGTLANTASASSAMTDPVPGNNSATDTDTLTPQVDLQVSKIESADPVTAGSGVGNLTHTITVTNAGPSTATSVTLSEVLTLPAGVTLVSATPSQGTFVSPNWTVGTLAPSGSATLTVVLTVGASTATGTNTVCDTATVTGVAAGETLISTGDDADTECTSVQRRVDIVVSKTESIDPVVAGSGTGNLTYTVTVANNGPSDASGITLSEVLTLPAGVTLVSATPSQGSFVSPNWTVGNLASGGSATLTVVLTASAATVPGTDVICDTATLTAVTETQVGTGNESDTECTSVVTSADLSITKVDDADPPPAGSNLTYTITVTNNGPSNATGVVVTDPLPAAVTYVSDTCGASNVPPWTWNIGNLDEGDSVSCDIVVSINPTPPGSISNTATVTATTNDAVGSNNSDTEDTTLDATPPRVDNLTTLADTVDGELTECETVNDRKVNAFVVTFDEAMAESGAGSVTDTANYRLVQPGANQTFDSTGCAVAGDDVAVAISSVSYDTGTFTATVSTAARLADGPHRVVVCDTLTDAAGNRLDGDENGTAQPSLVRSFRVDALNLFANGHFDCSLTGWTATAATAGEITRGTADVDGATAISGSARVTNLAPGTNTTFTLDQCVPVIGGVTASLGSRARLAAGPTVSVNLVRECEFFSGVCAGAVGTVSDVVTMLDTGGTWLSRTTVVPIPPAAQTALCRFRFETPTAQSFTGDLDRLFFRLDGAIFSDGFESGGTGGWSLCSGTGCTP